MKPLIDKNSSELRCIMSMFKNSYFFVKKEF